MHPVEICAWAWEGSHNPQSGARSKLVTRHNTSVVRLPRTLIPRASKTIVGMEKVARARSGRIDRSLYKRDFCSRKPRSTCSAVQKATGREVILCVVGDTTDPTGATSLSYQTDLYLIVYACG